LKGHALLAEQNPQALMADVLDHPLGDQEVGQLGRLQVETADRDPEVCSTRAS
jgi:hypothetical protein